MRPIHGLSLLLVTYWTVLAAELIGDKTIYTVTALGSRYAQSRVYAGVSLAFAGKVAAAILLGQFLTALPKPAIAGMSAATFFTTAVLLWRKRSEPASAASDWTAARPGGLAIAFAAIFFSEWGDVGQISTAALAARYGMPFAVGLGATAALMTKSLLALTLGVQLRKRLSTRVLQAAAAGSCCILGAISLAG
jgi:Ca2+/H+ antiporter, TMEM165/GDT1 family